MTAPASRRRYGIHSALFFAPLFAAGMWNVTLANVLRAQGRETLVAYVFACGAVASLVAPLFVGGLADQKFPPERLLKWLAAGAAAALATAFVGIARGWGDGAVLAAFQAHSLCGSPMFSMVSAVVLAQMADPANDFAKVRIWGTVGWIASGWTVSWVLLADASVLSGYVAAGVLAVFAAGLWWLPESAPPDRKEQRTWGEIFGFDALGLLGHRDHRVVFLTTVLFSVPLAAFVPFTPLHLRDLGLPNPSALMTLGQLTEVVCLLGLGTVLKKVRLKWIFLAAIVLGVARFVLCAAHAPWTLLVGISIHGFCYTLFFITAQIYMAERIDATMRARAQALFFLVSSGVGNLLGFLANGWWKSANTAAAGATDWPRYWGGLAVVSAAIAVYFFVSYRGIYHGLRRGEPDGN